MKLDRVSAIQTPIVSGRRAAQTVQETVQDPTDHVTADPSATPSVAEELTSRMSSVLRDPQTAVKFLNGYEATLKFDPTNEKKRMDNAKQSAHAFFRMYPSLYFQDISKDYKALATLAEKPAPQTWIQGDCHIANFGTVRGDHEVLWGVNDYDSCQKSQPELDITRLATSMLLTNPKLDSGKVSHAILDGYRTALENIAKNGPKLCSGVRSAKAEGPVKRLIDKASEQTQQRMLADFTNKDASRLVRNDIFVDVQPPLREELLLELSKILPSNTQILDIAQKLDSGGSTLGLPRYYALVDTQEDLPRIVEAKVMLPLPTSPEPAKLTAADERGILKGMDTMGSLPSSLRGGFSCRGLHYLAREREAEKSAIKPEKLDKDEQLILASQAGNALAKAHARSSDYAQKMLDWMDANPAVETHLAQFAAQYSNQSLEDWKAWTSKE